MIEITAEIRALIDKAAAGVELAGDEYKPAAPSALLTFLVTFLHSGFRHLFPEEYVCENQSAFFLFDPGLRHGPV